MGYWEPSPMRTSPPCSGGGKSGGKNGFELAMIMLKNNLKLSFFLCELLLLYFVCPVWFAPHLVHHTHYELDPHAAVKWQNQWT
jgi:hypothetical protein